MPILIDIILYALESGRGKPGHRRLALGEMYMNFFAFALATPALFESALIINFFALERLKAEAICNLFFSFHLLIFKFILGARTFRSGIIINFKNYQRLHFFLKFQKNLKSFSF